MFDQSDGDVIFKCNSYFIAKFQRSVVSSNTTIYPEPRAADTTESYRYSQIDLAQLEFPARRQPFARSNCRR
ncbi:hypothetical protein HJFPF1_10425 [Paramyrothecium foliicola]|nr:hypothetical protein HJFPF1_10425 [Paramyrothecium foliicola]